MIINARESVGEAEWRSQDEGNPCKKNQGEEEEGRASRESQVENENLSVGQILNEASWKLSREICNDLHAIEPIK